MPIAVQGYKRGRSPDHLFAEFLGGVAFDLEAAAIDIQQCGDDGRHYHGVGDGAYPQDDPTSQVRWVVHDDQHPGEVAAMHAESDDTVDRGADAHGGPGGPGSRHRQHEHGQGDQRQAAIAGEPAAGELIGTQDAAHHSQ